MMHRLSGYLLITFLSTLFFSSCTKRESGSSSCPIVSVSVAPQEWFVCQIAGDLVTIQTMVPRGANPEEYDPAPRDLARLEESALYLYTGTLPFEVKWLDRLNNSDTRRVALSEDLPHHILFPEEEEVTHREESQHIHPLGDPHFWTSFEGAEIIAKTTYQALRELLPRDSVRLKEGYDSVRQEIDRLRKEADERLGRPGHAGAFVIYHPSLTAFAKEVGMRQIVIEKDGKEPTPKQIAETIEVAKREKAKVLLVQKEYLGYSLRTISSSATLTEIEINPYGYDWASEMSRIIEALSK